MIARAMSMLSSPELRGLQVASRSAGWWGEDGLSSSSSSSYKRPPGADQRVSPNACALAPDRPDARSKKLRSSRPAQPHFAQVPVLPPCRMIFHDVTCPVRLPRPTALAIVDRALVDYWRQAREQAVLLDGSAYALTCETSRQRLVPAGHVPASPALAHARRASRHSAVRRSVRARARARGQLIWNAMECYGMA